MSDQDLDVRKEVNIGRIFGVWNICNSVPSGAAGWGVSPGERESCMVTDERMDLRTLSIIKIEDLNEDPFLWSVKLGPDATKL